MSKPYVSWGRYPYKQQQGMDLHWRPEKLDFTAPFLPQGNARSYGDSCMLQDGAVLSTRFMNRFMDFDVNTGLIRCEAGVTLAEILSVAEPQGWFLPVTPGTKFATVGGCIANDVHGKNHHVEGTFGRHVTQFELLRSDGSKLICSSSDNVEWFAGTIGGLGLTGFISWAELQLKRMPNSAVNVENIKYQSLADFFELSNESEENYEYTVAWVDCLASGSQLGRGHFSRANHARPVQPKPEKPKLKLSMPVDPPLSLVNSVSLKAFNWLYYNRQFEDRSYQTTHYDPFFYPLDHVGNWNRMYGPNGFLQYQCVIPLEHSEAAITELLQRIARANYGSFLAVLKVFGEVTSPGLLSFPRPGTTLALDFPYQGNRTMKLFDELDEVVVQSSGALYPAKDAHMKSEHFKLFYPNAEKLEALRDPKINSSFWQRVMGSKP